MHTVHNRPTHPTQSNLIVKFHPHTCQLRPTHSSYHMMVLPTTLYNTRQLQLTHPPSWHTTTVKTFPTYSPTHQVHPLHLTHNNYLPPTLPQTQPLWSTTLTHAWLFSPTHPQWHTIAEAHIQTHTHIRKYSFIIIITFIEKHFLVNGWLHLVLDELMNQNIL